MGHFWKKAPCSKGTAGRLVKGAHGHLLKLPDALHVEIADLGGSLAVGNGSHDLPRTSYFGQGMWRTIVGGTISILVQCGCMTADCAASGDNWRWTCVVAVIGAGMPGCRKRWCLAPVEEQDPTGGYAPTQCIDGSCEDAQTCAKSAGATCDVSVP